MSAARHIACSVSKAVISRGDTSVTNVNTSNLIKHYKMHRPKEHNETALPKLDETVMEYISCSQKDVQSGALLLTFGAPCVPHAFPLHIGWTQYCLQHLPIKVWCGKQIS